MDDKQILVAPEARVRRPAEQPSQQEKPQVDGQGRRLFDDQGQPIHWATPRDRAVALFLALVVIAITIAFTWSIATGDLFRR